MNSKAARPAAPTATLLDDLLAETSRTFALTIPRLPEPTRREVTVAYLLFRIADTLEDAELWSGERKHRELEHLAALVRDPSRDQAEALASRWKSDPPCAHGGYLRLLGELPAVLDAALSLGARASALVTDHTLRTIEGMASFVAREREGLLHLRDGADLRAYCYAVAGIVGELLTELFLEHLRDERPLGAELRAEAARFGEGLQLVNILKDAAADRRRGRCYLPQAVDVGEVFALARADLEVAAGYCSRLERAGAPGGFVAFTALPVLLARATLDRVQEDGSGSKLTRPEVARIVQDLEQAGVERRFAALLKRT